MHSRSHDNGNRRLEAAKSKMSIAEDFGAHESTLRKSSKTGTESTSQSRFMATFSHKERNLWLLQRFRRQTLWSKRISLWICSEERYWLQI